MRLVGDYDEQDDGEELFDGPDEHDQHLMDDDLEETVPCAHCGREIWSYSERCPHCGIYFRGEAWQYKAGEPGSGAGGMGFKYLVRVLAAGAVILAFLWLIFH